MFVQIFMLVSHILHNWDVFCTSDAILLLLNMLIFLVSSCSFVSLFPSLFLFSRGKPPVFIHSQIVYLLYTKHIDAYHVLLLLLTIPMYHVLLLLSVHGSLLFTLSLSSTMQ